MINKKDKNKSHLKNLMSIAMADGQFAESERHILFSVARRLGMSDEDISIVYENPESIQFIPPSSHNEKMDQIYDFIYLISADRTVDPKELDICKKLASHLEIAPSVVDGLLSKFVVRK
ncbi:MAG: TerB family tellurite resistance protein [Bacteroidota bacterium]